jgi:anti-sigma B factor antagonist
MEIVFIIHIQDIELKQQEPTLKLNLETRTYEAFTVLHCKGRIVYRDEASALSSRVAELLTQSRLIVLDLSCVEMIDSAGLGELVVALMSGQIMGRPVKLAGPNKLVRKLLELTNLSSVFQIYPSLQEAILDHQAPCTTAPRSLGASI